MSTISASTLTTTALQYTADTTGALVFQTGATPTTALTLNADQSATFAGAVSFATASFTNLSYTGTLTGGTGVVNLGSGQFYKDASGNIGLGTASPQTNSLTISRVLGSGTISLQASTTPVSGNRLFLIGFGTDTDTYKARISAYAAGNWTTGTDTPTNLAFNTTPVGSATSVEAMRIDSNGYLLVGTTTPTYIAYSAVEVNHATSSSVVLKVNNTTKGYTFADSSGYRIVTSGATPMWFATNGTEAMRIDSTGKVGIGTSSPSSYYATKLVVSCGDEDGITIANNNGGSANRSLLVFANGTSGASTYNGFIGYNHASNFMTFNVNSGTEKMRINTNGNVVLQGGTTTASGIGITFPATQSASSDANCLDDYEEGTWTPTFITDGTSPTYTVSAIQGTYTKIGNVVYVNFYVLSVTGGGATGGSGNVMIGGLPFTAHSKSIYGRIFPGYLGWGGLTGKWTPHVEAGIGWNPNINATTLNLYANSTTYANGNFELQGTGFYYTS